MVRVAFRLTPAWMPVLFFASVLLLQGCSLLPGRANATDDAEGGAGLSTYKAKDHYQRTRPFVAFKTASCTPDEDAKLAKDGAYPSGHSAVGWSWALVLAEVAPQRSDALLQRGRAFGQSRGICGAHWQSDIEAGRLIGAATVARLHTHAGFTAQLTAARDEVARMRNQNLPLPRDCQAEATALDSSRTLAP
jgi:acid phosphatase (class A)